MNIHDQYVRVERVAAAHKINPELCNAEAQVLFDSLDNAFLSLEAKVLTGVKREVTLTAPFIGSVWDAICVYWLAGLAFWLADRTSWAWLFDVWDWCLSHEQVVTKTETFNTRTCPHVEVADQETHIRWVTGDLS